MIMMKKMGIIAGLVLLCSGTYAQKKKQIQVPDQVRSSFVKAFPGVAGTWERADGNYEVNFRSDGKEMSCVMNSRGEVLETETEIGPDTLPAAAIAYLKNHYAHQKVKGAARIQQAGGTVTFEAEIPGKDILFDANGNFKKEEKH
ncbi:MAG: hypothetical protein EOP50_07045 [Sphingobacteriales bacterium]|nr:MAG: hypothetical protein EOP50_07045 [Sphingobacteriales bacterium]